MAELGATKSTVFDPGSTSINPVEAARREMMMRQARDRMILERLRKQGDIAAQQLEMQAQQLAAQERLGMRGLDIQERGLDLQATAPQRQAEAQLSLQGGTGMELADKAAMHQLGMQTVAGDQALAQTRAAQEPAMAQLDFQREQATQERDDSAIRRKLEEMVLAQQLNQAGIDTSSIMGGDAASAAPVDLTGGGASLQGAVDSLSAQLAQALQTGDTQRAMVIQANLQRAQEAMAAQGGEFDPELAKRQAIRELLAAGLASNTDAGPVVDYDKLLPADKDAVLGIFSDEKVSGGELEELKGISSKYKAEPTVQDVASGGTRVGQKMQGEIDRVKREVQTALDEAGGNLGFTLQKAFWSDDAKKELLKRLEAASESVDRLVNDLHKQGMDPNSVVQMENEIGATKLANIINTVSGF